MKMEEMEEIVFGCCGAVVWLAKNFVEEKRKTKEAFYCPNGHGRSFRTSTEEILRKELAEARSELESKTATIQKLKEGKCPLCWKTVKDLSSHLKLKH